MDIDLHSEVFSGGSIISLSLLSFVERLSVCESQWNATWRFLCSFVGFALETSNITVHMMGTLDCLTEANG